MRPTNSCDRGSWATSAPAARAAGGIDELEIGEPLLMKYTTGPSLEISTRGGLAAACFDRFHVVRGSEVVDEWRPIRGW